MSKILTLRFHTKQNRAPVVISCAGMETLAAYIAKEIESQLKAGEWKHCAVYEKELQRLWPLDEPNRRAKIAQFAKEYGFHLRFYAKGLCAIFDKESPSN